MSPQSDPIYSHSLHLDLIHMSSFALSWFSIGLAGWVVPCSFPPDTLWEEHESVFRKKV